MIPDTYHFGEEVYYLISNQFQGNPLRKKTFDIEQRFIEAIAFGRVCVKTFLNVRKQKYFLQVYENIMEGI